MESQQKLRNMPYTKYSCGADGKKTKKNSKRRGELGRRLVIFLISGRTKQAAIVIINKQLTKLATTNKSTAQRSDKAISEDVATALHSMLCCVALRQVIN